MASSSKAIIVDLLALSSRRRRTGVHVLGGALIVLLLSAAMPVSQARSVARAGGNVDSSALPSRPSGQRTRRQSSHETAGQSWLTCFETLPAEDGNDTQSETSRRNSVLHQPLNNIFQEINTPSFPNPYPSNYECVWSFSIPENSSFKLITTHAEFEYSTSGMSCHGNDSSHVEIVGIKTEPTVFRRYCGNLTRKGSVVSGNYNKSPILQVYFRSDNQSVSRARGFRAVFFSFPKHGLISFMSQESTSGNLGCAQPRCSKRFGQRREYSKYYYSAGDVKSLLRKVLKDSSESTHRAGEHHCRQHSLFGILAQQAYSTSSPWRTYKRNPCERRAWNNTTESSGRSALH